MTRFTTPYKPGDIILISFPFTDFSTFKQRPALIISSRHFNSTHGDVVIVAISSHISVRLREDEYLLSKSEQKLAGLPKTSLIKFCKIITIDQRLIRKRLGCLSPEITKQVIEKIKTIVIDFD